jgi:hypothetical protein
MIKSRRFAFALSVSVALAASAAGYVAWSSGSVSEFAARLPASGKLDASYFTDAGELGAMNGLYDMMTGKSADELPIERRKLCARTEFDIAKNATEYENLFAFANSSSESFVNFGICWWHSRFQRSALYLANFRPNLEKLEHNAYIPLIMDLIAMKKVVEIPGYRNFHEFTGEFEKEIIGALAEWQILDGAKLAPVIDGLSGSTHEPAVALRERMDQTYDRMLRKKAILWQQLILPGIGTHSWLLLDIQPIREGNADNPFIVKGYKLAILDSNSPSRVITPSYHFGDSSISFYGEKMIPVTDHDDELPKFEDALREYCGGHR